jgi:hypothetical protein
MTTRRRPRIGTLTVLPLAVAAASTLSACSGEPAEEELVFDCVVQEQPDGDYVVLDPSECDDDGRTYASGHGGIYPFLFFHSSGVYYPAGGKVPKAAVPVASLALANNAAAKTSALNAAAKSTGLKVGANGVTSGTKGGFGSSSKSGGGGG